MFKKTAATSESGLRNAAALMTNEGEDDGISIKVEPGRTNLLENTTNSVFNIITIYPG